MVRFDCKQVRLITFIIKNTFASQHVIFKIQNEHIKKKGKQTHAHTCMYFITSRKMADAERLIARSGNFSSDLLMGTYKQNTT